MLRLTYISVFAALLVVFVVPGASQSPRPASSIFEKDGLRFSYPVSWKVTDLSSAEVQYVLLGSGHSLPLIAVVSPRQEIAVQESFDEMERAVRLTYVSKFDKLIEPTGRTLVKDDRCLDVAG